MSALLLISCSDRKLRSPRTPIAAIERYDGVFYRIIRKARREGTWARSINLVILSAKYGVLLPRTPIRYYDQRMDKRRATALQESIQRSLSRFLRKNKFDRIYINLGQAYAPTIRGLCELEHATWASGGIGERAQLLKQWLLAEHRRSERGRAR